MPHKDITVLQRRHGQPPINPRHHALRVLLIAGAMLAAVFIACNQATEPEGLLPWPTPTPEAEPTQTPTFQPAEQVIPLPTKTAAATSTPTIPTPTLPQETTKATPPRHPQVTQGSRMRPDQPANPMLGSSRFPPVCSTPVGCGGTGPSPAGARTARTSAGQRPLGFSNRLPAASPKSMPAPTIPAPYARTEPWSAGAAVLLMMFPRRPRKRP